MTEINPHNESDVLRKKREVVDLARRMIEGSVGVIEGSRKLASIRHDLEFLGSFDDFNAFVAVDSETDHLPVAPSVRGQWSENALTRADVEIDKYERAFRPDVQQACIALIRRFSE